jgi:2-dehydro-3-deoxygluconokinase
VTRFVCFGELLIRLSPPGRELLLQTPQLTTHYGGAEANVAISLARFGHDARMVSVVPDNALAHGALGELRRYGVDTSGVRVWRGPHGSLLPDRRRRPTRRPMCSTIARNPLSRSPHPTRSIGNRAGRR